MRRTDAADRGGPRIHSVLGESGVRLAVASSASRQRVESTLEQFDLTRCFAAVVTGDDVANGKPDPAIFQTACQQLDGDPGGNSLVIEDAVSGVKGARAAGMKCLGIADSERARLLYEAGAHFVVPDFKGLRHQSGFRTVRWCGCNSAGSSLDDDDDLNPECPRGGCPGRRRPRGRRPGVGDHPRLQFGGVHRSNACSRSSTRRTPFWRSSWWTMDRWMRPAGCWSRTLPTGESSICTSGTQGRQPPGTWRSGTRAASSLPFRMPTISGCRRSWKSRSISSDSVPMSA